MESTNNDDVVDIDKFSHWFNGLNAQDKQIVMAASRFGNFSQQTKEAYAFLMKMYANYGRDTKCIYLMVIVRMLNMTSSQRDYVKNTLKKVDKGQVHWKHFTKVDTVKKLGHEKKRGNELSFLFEENDMEFIFSIPGKPDDKTLKIEKDCFNQCRFVFITPNLAARLLIGNHNCLVGRELGAFSVGVQEEVVKLIQGKKSVLDNVVEQVQSNKRQKIEEKPMSMFEKVELEKSLVELQKVKFESNLSLLKNTLEFVREVGRMDDHDALFFKTHGKNICSRALAMNTTSTTIVESYDVQDAIVVQGHGPMDIIEISEELMKMGKNPAKENLSKIGKILARLYREKYNKEPEKIQKLINGNVRDSNVYYKKDLDLMHEAINNYFEELDNFQQLQATRVNKISNYF